MKTVYLVDMRPYEAFPGGDLIEQGIQDLRDGHESMSALLVSIGAPRLRRAGIAIVNPIRAPEHRLYEVLSGSDSDSAHARYNALVRRLVSFERAVECGS